MTGKVAFVSGGASGIGRAAALAYAAAGAHVALGDVDEAGAADVAALIEQGGGQALALPLDVRDPAQVEAAIARTVERFGRLDAACNAAGIQGPLLAAGDYPEQDWEAVIGINLTGVWSCMKHELAAMVASGGGAIVNISSNFGLVGSESMPAYCASKHGVIGLSKSAALDYAKRGVRVNALCPGATRTPLIDKIFADDPGRGEQLVAQIEAALPMGRMAEADEVAQAVVWLCSDQAAMVTGAILSVDGGYVAR
ncbi:MAG: SDR family oxidoreductase [Thermoleophilia bacterium]